MSTKHVCTIDKRNHERLLAAQVLLDDVVKSIAPDHPFGKEVKAISDKIGDSGYARWLRAEKVPVGASRPSPRRSASSRRA